ncbi:MAG: TonB-dependent receptor [Ignavibacteriaceae bacterium]|nr:TonB-dependent receptor [Ignavibacteriaceae bacterium]
MRRIINILSILIITLILAYNSALAAGANISGNVKDASTGDPLFGANVLIVGTSLGATTDMNGMYIIRNVPAGSYSIRITYIGYKEKKIDITARDGENLVYNFKLEPVAVEGQTVVVTAQANGQTQAINQQLASDQIVNVVSAARIQELPDANAAESVGRLPGISILRSGGEGDQVAIRGLAPQFNEVEINGVRMASSNSEDRNTDLSMISSDMLEGIQVTKTVTADMDANVIGGVVNFELREAKTDVPGVPKFSLLIQGSYNGLPDAYNKYNNYKYVGTAEDRFLDNRLGVFVQALIERRNLSDNELNATYGKSANSTTDYLTSNITLDDNARDRQRKNGVVTLDYKLPEGKITFSNFLSSSETETLDRQQYYNVSGNTQSFIFNYSKETLNSITDMLEIEQQLPVFHVKANFSHTYSETKDPYNWGVNFINGPAGLLAYSNAKNINPHDVVIAANNNLGNSFLNTVTTSNSFTRERDLAAGADFDTHLTFSDMVSAVIKFGGKYQYQTRSYNYDTYDGEPFGLASGKPLVSQLSAAFPWMQVSGDGVNVLMSPFVQQGYDYGKFLGGDYSMIYPLNIAYMRSMVNYMNANHLSNNITYNYDIGGSTKSDYSGDEDISAAYLMATVDIGPSLTIIPGVRYQQLKTIYTASQGLQGPNPYSNYANQQVTYTAYHPYWLPDILVRYKPADWFDVRLAYTNTVSYPSYASLAPIITVTQSAGTLQWNGFQLDPIKSANYDAYVSFYNNTIGLFTAGAFLKQISNLIYQYTFTPATSAALVKYYPDWVPNKTPLTGIKVTEYLNDPYKVNNSGMELEWQTHFWYLPGVLSGLVMNVNYTHIFSKAEYPIQYVNTSVRPTKYVDSSYYAPLLYQPDNILNISLGFDYEAFSIRISSIYSSRIFTGPDPTPQLRAYTAGYNRWDVSLKQGLPIEGLQVFCNLYNINRARDINNISAPNSVPSSEQDYDYSIELGLRYQL